MTKENIHPVIQLRICCQDSRWMSEYWWSWKLHQVPYFHMPPVEAGDQRGGGLCWVSMERHLSQYSESQGVKKEINLTLKQQGLHLFVKDVRCCLNDDANSSKPTCSWHTAFLQSAFVFLVTEVQIICLTSESWNTEHLKVFTRTCDMKKDYILVLVFDYKRLKFCFNQYIYLNFRMKVI